MKWRILLCSCTVAAWGVLQVACDDGRDFDDDDDNDDNGGDSDGDSDSDSDGDSDGDTDTGPCEPVAWGSGLSVGSPVANWTHQGYIDSDLDGVVEQEQVTFDLEQIHCMGVQSIVLLIGDST